MVPKVYAIVILLLHGAIHFPVVFIRSIVTYLKSVSPADILTGILCNVLIHAFIAILTNMLFDSCVDMVNNMSIGTLDDMLVQHIVINLTGGELKHRRMNWKTLNFEKHILDITRKHQLNFFRQR